jgi:hypothetical protein
MPKHNGGNNKGGNKPKLRLPVYMPDTNPGASNVVAINPPSITRGQGHDNNGLTVKREAFCQAMTSGHYSSQSAAYRVAFDCSNMAAASVHAEASRLMANPAIASRIAELNELKKAVNSLNSAQIRAHVVARLHIESLDPDSSPASRIRALELLGKLGGVAAFERVTEEASVSQDADTVTKALQDKLQALLKAGAA